MLLTLVQSNTVVKETVFSTLAVFLAYTVAYVPLLLLLGYNYEFYLISTVIFSSIGVLVTSGLLKGRSQNSNDSGTLKIIFGCLIGAVMVEELLLNSVLAAYGFAFSILGLVLLPILAVALGRNNSWLRIALETVALIFATRVVMSPFSLVFLNQPIFLPTIYTLILAALVFYLTYRRIPAGEVRIKLGRRGLRFQVSSGLGVGAVIGFVEYIVLGPQPIFGDAGFIQMFVYNAIVLMVMVGVTEEIMFRGLLQTSLEKIIPTWQAIGVASIMFGLMHVGWMNPLEVLLAYGAGVIFGYLATMTESLIAPVLAHGFGNFVLYLIAFYLS